MTRKLAGARTGAVQYPGRGEPPVDGVDKSVAHPPAEWRIEGLQLDEKLIDHAGDALTAGAGAQATPGGADGVDLLDETDGAALPPGIALQGPEIGPDPLRLVCP